MDCKSFLFLSERSILLLHLTINLRTIRYLIVIMSISDMNNNNKYNISFIVKQTLRMN